MNALQVKKRTRVSSPLSPDDGGGPSRAVAHQVSLLSSMFLPRICRAHKVRLQERVALLKRLIREERALEEIVLMSDPKRIERVGRVQDAEERLAATFALRKNHYLKLAADQRERLDRLRNKVVQKALEYERLLVVRNCVVKAADMYVLRDPHSKFQCIWNHAKAVYQRPTTSLPALSSNTSKGSSSRHWSYPPIDTCRSSSSYQPGDLKGTAHAHACDRVPPHKLFAVTSVDAQQQSETAVAGFAFYTRWRAFFEELHQINIVEVADPGKTAISAHVNVDTRGEDALVVHVRATAILHGLQFVRFDISWPIARIVDCWQHTELFANKFAHIRIFRENEEQVAASVEALKPCRPDLHAFVETLLRVHEHLFRK